MTKFILAAVATASLLIACASKPVATKTAATSEESEANLTRDEATQRASLISDVSYDFDAHIDGQSDSFKATTSIEFKLARIESVFLDFQNGAQLDGVTINGKPTTVTYQNHRLILPVSALRAGENKVGVSYVQKYSHDGRGLHRFLDPEDKNVYLYTQFESYDAHQMFPCFDQPDLKATMTMKVTAPNGWQVITTTRESSVKKSGDESIWTFPATPKISTYLFSLHAGPYAKWEEKAGRIPMRLFVRQALKKYVRPKEWFVPTRHGLKFYGDYFAYPYPFKKFDEIIAPDFNAGAMENVAAITFSEHFVHRGPSTREEREGTASVILHEMAHMWFGDLVTMKWWNGLWLNESFATFMSALSQDHATEFKESWTTFYRHEKLWAYWQDQLVTTHPIEARIDDVATAFTNFDGITYGKGASVLKQLNYYLGEKAFRDGVRYYFKQHAYTNTTLQDFIGALEHASGKSLQEWSHAWLEDAGLDTAEAVYTCNANRIASFAIKAAGPDGKLTPRVHKTLVQVYNEQMKPVASSTVEYKQGATEVKALLGKPCPSFVDLNQDDHDFVKTKFDSKSLKSIQQNVMALKDSFTRLRIWPSLDTMVRDHELTPDAYLSVAAKVLPAETDLASLEQLTQPLAEMFRYLPDQGAARTARVEEFEKLLWARTLRASPGSDLQKIMLMKFVEIGESQDARDKMVSLLNGSLQLKGLSLDADRRWTFVVRLSSLGDARAAGLIASESKKDTSESGIQMALAAEAAAPNAKAKRVWFDKLITDNEVKYARARTATRWMFSPLQDKIREEFANEFYTKLPDFASRRQIDIVELFASHFVPTTCSMDSAARLQKFIDAHPELAPTIVKQLKTDHQEDVRCALARASK